MLLKSQETLTCDVLVIGGGGAGLRSAIAAKSNKADVLLVSKSRVGYATNTYFSKAIIAASGWGNPHDNSTTHIMDTVKGGCFLNDQSMIATVAERIDSEIAFLRECGVRFEMQAGRPRVIRNAGHKYPRHVHGEHLIGSDLVLPLNQCAKQLGVRLAEQVFVTRFLTSENRITGATGITSDGRFLQIHAKAVVLATGGYAQIFLNTDNAPGITGDGLALAYDMGIPLKDMEFVQFYPTATGKRGNRILVYEKMLTLSGAVLRNDDGEDILQRSDISDPMSVTRDQLAQLIMKEAMQGREVIMDLEGLSESTAGQLRQLLPSRWWKGQKSYKIAPTTHFCMGGIVVDQCGETAIDGLFGVGEVTAGVHGANRLGGNALAEIFAMGSLVGEKAAERAMEIETTTLGLSKAAENERLRLEAAFSEQGLSPKQLIHELKELMWLKVSVIRRKNELEAAISRLQNPRPRAAIVSPGDLIRLLEFQNMRLVAEMVCKAALKRTESRGSHFRDDYPEEDNRHWLKNIVVCKRDSGMEFESRPVRLNRVKPDIQT